MPVTVEMSNETLVVTLNNPNKLNAMSADDYRELAAAWTQAKDDEQVRAVVLSGKGDRAFSVGADLGVMDRDKLALQDLFKPMASTRPDRQNFLWKPVIAAVRGHCIGGGMTLMMACDLRVADTSARFSLPEVIWGLPVNARQALVRTVRAADLSLVGSTITAETALEWGLVNRVVATDEVHETALDLADRIAANAPLAIAATKELMTRSKAVDLDIGLRLEDLMLRVLENSQDFQEGRKAFVERRVPRFVGK